MSTPPRTVGAVLSLLVVGPILLTGCADGGTSEAGASSSASAPSSADAASTNTPTAAPMDEEPSEPAEFVADTTAATEDASADARVTVSDIRIGGGDGFDRVVFDVGGTGTPGWDVRYVDAAWSQGSGEAVDVAGNAVLQVTLTGAGYPYDTGVEEHTGGPLTSPDTTVVGEVVWDATYEGTSVAFIGTTGEYPFRVYALENPTRVVVDLAHAAG